MTKIKQDYDQSREKDQNVFNNVTFDTNYLLIVNKS